MTPEEYQRLKEAEKEHLRKLKKLKDTARSLARRNKVARTLGDMVSTSQDALDAQEQMVSDLAQETARQEARLELALEAQAERDADADDEQALADADEELAAVRAKQLLHQIKRQMGVVADDSGASEATSERAASTPASEPSKTLGPHRTAAPSPESAAEKDASDESASDGDDPLPDKTIGRMKP